MEVKEEGGLCRCCNSYTDGNRSLRDVSTGGPQYVRSLKDTFCITLSAATKGSVCESCVARLRDASDFKRLVLRTERRFQRLQPFSTKSEPEVSVDLKVEVDTLEDTEHRSDWDGDDYLNDPNYSDAEDDKPLKPSPLKLNSKIASNVKKALALADRTRSIYKRMLPKLNMERLSRVNSCVRRLMEREGDLTAPYRRSVLKPAETRNVVRTIRVPRFKMAVRPPAKRLAKLRVSDVDPNSTNTVGADLLPAEKRAARRIIKQNALAILKNTTACPFIYYHSNFRCFYCRKTFFDFYLLRAHTIEAHNDVKQEARKINAFRDLMMVDISSLQCRRCQQEYSDIDSIKEHLVTEHGVSINRKHNDDIAAFKLNSQNFKCHLCDEEFHVFRNLSSHLNKHYANYMCDICGKPFISWERYKNHETTHVMGNFPCSKCDQVFSTVKARAAHSISEHRVTRYGCPLCSERFEKYLERTVHMSVSHNVTHRFKCPQCPKEFIHKPHLRAHVNNAHRPREKKVECPECGMRFTDNNSLSRHMVSHTGEKLFVCKVCGKKYGRKYSLTEHMRVHSKGHARSRPPHLMS